MSGLAASRWAHRVYRQDHLYSRPRYTTIPPITTTTANPLHLPPSMAPQPLGATSHPQDELGKYSKLVRRLKWKLPYLAEGYRLATILVPPADELFAEGQRESRKEAELMFKLDFFEYYMLLERALVHLLGVFGVVVSREFAAGVNGGMEKGVVGMDKGLGIDGNGYSNGNGNGMYTHRYHANVLDALDNPANPLYTILGMGAPGDVRRQLARAKDLRNRWKNADFSSSSSSTSYPQKDGVDREKVAPMALESYDLEHILESIFAGFDAAFVVAAAWIEELGRREAEMEQRMGDMGGGAMPVGNGVGNGYGVGDSGANTAVERTEEEQWEFMVDAMDWEAV
jgi:hypothetical protein